MPSKLWGGLERVSNCPEHFVVKGMKVIMCWVNVVLGRLKDLLGYLLRILRDILRIVFVRRNC